MADKIFFYALCAAGFLSPFYMGTLDMFPQCVFLVALSLLLFLPLFSRKQIILFPAPFRIFTAYLAVVFLSAVLAPEARWAARNACLQILLYFTFFLLPFFVIKKENIIMLLKCLVFSGFCVSLYGIGIYILYGHTDYFIFSTFLNPNECAGFLIILLPVAMGIYMCEESFLKKYRFFLFLTLMSLCLILTGSRAAWASEGIAFAVFASLVSKAKSKLPQAENEGKNVFTLKFFFITFALLLVFLLSVKTPLLKKLLHVFSLTDRSLMFRILVWKGSLRMLRARPLFGFGPGTFEWWYPHFKLGGALTKMVHNTYIHQAAESGLAGLFLFLCFIISHIHAMKAQCQSSPAHEKFMLTGILCASIAFLLHNAFDYTFYIPATGCLFFLLAGCFYALASPDNRPQTADRRPKTNIFIGAGASVVYFAVLCTFCARAGLSDYYVQKAWDAEFSKNFRQAYVLYTKASQWDPKNAEALMQRGVYARYFKEYSLSESVLRQAIQFAPSHAAFHNELAYTYLKTGKRKEAIQQLELSSALNPTGTSAMRALGHVYFNDAMRNLKEHKMRGAFLCLNNALQWYEKINTLSRSVYESDLYEPLAGRERNTDFKEAENMTEKLHSLLAQLKIKEAR